MEAMHTKQGNWKDMSDPSPHLIAMPRHPSTKVLNSLKSTKGKYPAQHLPLQHLAQQDTSKSSWLAGLSMLAIMPGRFDQLQAESPSPDLEIFSQEIPDLMGLAAFSNGMSRGLLRVSKTHQL